MALALSGRKCRLPPETDCQEDSVLHLAPSKHTLPEEAHPPFCAGRKLRDIDKALLWNILHEDPECPTRALLDKVAQLLDAARHLPSSTGLRAHTYDTVFGLLVVTGMRISELVRLDHSDVDLASSLLTIRHTKFRTSRCLPLHRTTQQALSWYVGQRDRVYPLPQSPSFFVSEHGRRLTTWAVRATFIQLSRQIGLRSPHDSHGPRLHDFRHRFAVQTLVRWYREDIDVDRHLPELSTYLGHVKVSDTYWYLSATPELLGLATQRLEQAHRRLPS